MTSYFSHFLFSRAEKNREALEKTNPQEPINNDETEEFLQRITSQDDGAKQAAAEEGNPAASSVEQTPSQSGIVPEVESAQPDVKAVVQDYEQAVADGSKDKETGEDEAKTGWSRYIPSVPAVPSIASFRKSREPEDTAGQKEQGPESVASNDDDGQTKPATKEAEAQPTSEKAEEDAKPTARTWSSYLPSLSRTPQDQTADSLASAAQSFRSGDGVVLNEDGTEDKEATKRKDEREVSVLLDQLNLSAINNRVFSFSQDSQRLYREFTIVLKDMVNGGPTAYDDLERLIKENDKSIGEMFRSMPPFVQALVKSLPAKFLTMASASGSASTDEVRTEQTKTDDDEKDKKKQKRHVPSVRALATQQGTAASMLQSIMNFLKLRFPAFVTGTNILMSLAVFILLFVFWYCHKRGKETRLSREAAMSGNVSSGSASTESESDGESDDVADKTDEKKPLDAQTILAQQAAKKGKE